MFMLKTLQGSSYMGDLLSPKFFLHDLQKTKHLNGSNAETYKIFISYMKQNDIPITLDNLLKLMESFTNKYNDELTVKKFKKEMEIIKTSYFKDSMFDFVKNSAITVGFSVYYLIKSQFSKLFENKLKFTILTVVISIVIFSIVVLYYYHTTYNKNYYQELIHRVNSLREDLVNNNTYDISQLILSLPNKEYYTPIITKMLTEMKNNLFTQQIVVITSQENNIINPDNSNTFIYELNEDDTPNKELKEIPENEDIEEIIDIQLSNNDSKSDKKW